MKSTVPGNTCSQSLTPLECYYLTWAERRKGIKVTKKMLADEKHKLVCTVYCLFVISPQAVLYGQKECARSLTQHLPSLPRFIHRDRRSEAPSCSSTNSTLTTLPCISVETLGPKNQKETWSKIHLLIHYGILPYKQKSLMSHLKKKQSYTLFSL